MIIAESLAQGGAITVLSSMMCITAAPPNPLPNNSKSFDWTFGDYIQ
jgi:hypothetical protein